jgi:hypothetical protein
MKMRDAKEDFTKTALHDAQPIILITLQLFRIMAGVVIVLVILWMIAQWTCVRPYRENVPDGPIPLASTVPNTRLYLEYPRRIAPEARGSDPDKRLILTLRRDAGSPGDTISLAVRPVYGTLRFLDQEGLDRPGQWVVTTTYAQEYVETLYLESPNIWLPRTISMSVQLLPPTGAITQPLPVHYFPIEREGPLAGAVRRVVSAIPWQTVLIAVPGLLVESIKRLWGHGEQLEDLREQMEQAKVGGQRDRVRSLYREVQRTRLWMALSWGRRPPDNAWYTEMEALYRRAEAQFEFEQARAHRDRGRELQQRYAFDQARMEEDEANLHLTKGLELDPVYQKVRGWVERAQEQEEDYARSQDTNDWWFYPAPGAQELKRLMSLLQDEQETAAEVRERIAQVLGHVNRLETGQALLKALYEDKAPSVRLQAGWMLARRPRPVEPGLRQLKAADPKAMSQWLHALRPTALYRNPFAIKAAESDLWQQEHFYKHDVYQYLTEYYAKARAVFAGAGCGKTHCRLMLQEYLRQNSADLVIAYTDFDVLASRADRLSLRDHVRLLVQQVATKLDLAEQAASQVDALWTLQIKWLLQQVRERGYTGLHVLVDNIYGSAEAQSQPRVAELLLRNLVGDYRLLDEANLCFTFFLPLELKLRLVRYGGFTTSRIEIVDMFWDKEALHAIIARRVEQASMGPPYIDSLQPLTVGFQGPTLDQRLVRQAQGCPRRLIDSIDRIWQHRAQTWYDSGRADDQLLIEMADWARLLEHQAWQSPDRPSE